MADFRTLLNAGNKYNDDIHCALMNILGRRLVFGPISVASRLSLPRTVLGVVQMRAVFNEEAVRSVLNLNNGEHIPTLHSFSLAPSAVSTTTPNKSTISDVYESRTLQLMTVFDHVPDAKAQAKTKRAFWYGEGSTLRRAPWLLHRPVTAKQATCVRCLMARIRSHCVLCGASLCLKTCFELFHLEESLPAELSVQSASHTISSTVSSVATQSAASAMTPVPFGLDEDDDGESD